MAAFDDDDDLFPLSGSPRRHPPGDHNDDWDDPDERDLVPDEMATIRCSNCKKYILEDSIRCPYCKELQLEENHHRKPLWFILTAIVLILFLAVGYYFFGA